MDESFSLRRFVDQSLHEIALFDPAMCYLAASALYRERWGLASPYVGRSHYEMLPHLPERWRSIHQDVLGGAWRSCLHDKFRGRDGRIEWADWEMGPWFRAEGEVGGAVLLSSNASQQVSIERQLQRIERQLQRIEDERRSLMMTATDGIVVVDRTGTIISVNPALQSMFGYEEGELRGQNVSRLVPEERDGTPAPYRLARDARLFGRPVVLHARRRDGSQFPVRVVVNEIDHLDVYVGYIQDQTEYLALREEIVSVANLEQQRIGRELHDATQQELTGLALLADALVEQLETHRAPDADVTVARQLSEGLSGTQRSIQHLARGLLPVPVDAQGLEGALAALASSASRNTKVSIATEFSGRVPGFSSEAATHLYRIAQEALNNALRHARPHTVTLRLASSEQGCELQVEDDGTGFEPLRPSPTGVGLRLMEHRCSLAGGNLQMSFPKTGGTRVTCFVPTVSGAHA